MSPGRLDWPDAAFASVDVTPDRALPLAGYAKRCAPAERIESRLEASLLITAIGGIPLLLIGIDALFGSEPLRRALAARLSTVCPGITAARIHVIATHTHYAPSLDPARPGLGACDGDYVERVVQRLVSGVQQALADGSVRLHSVAQGQAQCSRGVYRRRLAWVRDSRSIRFRRSTVVAPDPHVSVNTALDVAHLRDERGAVQAILWSWPCHPVSHGQAALVSSDFPGAVRDSLRKLHGDAVPVFYLPGFCGDVRPDVVARRMSIKDRLTMPFVRPFASLDDADRERLFTAIRAAALEADAAARAADGRLTETATQPEAAQVPLASVLQSDAPGAPPSGHIECISLSLAPLRLCLINAEVSNAYQASAGRHDFATGCVNDVFGYLPTDEQIARGGYEVAGFRELFALHGRYDKPVEARVRAVIEAS